MCAYGICGVRVVVVYDELQHRVRLSLHAFEIWQGSVGSSLNASLEDEIGCRYKGPRPCSRSNRSCMVIISLQTCIKVSL